MSSRSTALPRAFYPQGYASRLQRSRPFAARASMTTNAWASGASSVMVRWMKASALESLRGAAGESHGRLAGRQVDDPHVAPEDPAAEPRSQGLGASLLGREPLGVGGGATGPRVRPALFDLGEAAVDEPPAEPVERLLDPPNVAKVAADADDHRRRSAGARPSSIAARIVLTVSARPTNIASPIRKWPMLSSTICGSPAMTRA